MFVFDNYFETTPFGNESYESKRKSFQETVVELVACLFGKKTDKSIHIMQHVDYYVKFKSYKMMYVYLCLHNFCPQPSISLQVCKILTKFYVYALFQNILESTQWLDDLWKEIGGK